MDAPLTNRLRTFVAIPLLVVALVAGGSTGLAGLQLTAAPQPAAGDDVAAGGAASGGFVSERHGSRQELLGERSNPTPAPVRAVPLGSLAAWAETVPDARAFWPSEPVAAPAPKAEKPKAEGGSKSTKSSKSNATSTKTTVASSPTREFSGTNHFWFPRLGINKRVHSYPCPRTRPPDNYLYRWGCAGSNNVYLLGHAYSVMKPLHDAYVSGRLRVGMAAWYANGSGKVRKYKITEWRVVKPDNASWAIASQSRPSMTLQTCVGKNDAYRLVVRLVAVS
ncbi:MAG: sortase [Chloroflexi bacterium]|nr:sortase [Chloroflexota bacterium]